MALITCPECETEVSDQAAQCPRCGHPLARAASNGQERPTQPEQQEANELTETQAPSSGRATVTAVLQIAGALALVVGTLLGLATVVGIFGRLFGAFLLIAITLAVAGFIMLAVGGLVAGRKPAGSVVGRNLAALAVLGLLAWVAYQLLPTEGRDVVNQIGIRTGVTVTPWIDRAESALRSQLRLEPEIFANSIQATTHPTGGDAHLKQWTVEQQGETLVATLDVEWTGGFLGGKYITRVTWRCNKQGHIEAKVTYDNTPQGAGSPKKLDEWFETECWPVLYSNAGGD